VKPVLILQHLHADGPAYLATWLRAQGLPIELRNTEAGEDFPESLDGYRALAILGGTMSANDELPSLRRAESLVRQGVAQGIPVIGHCLGGQLMARALGADVTRSPAPEVGWHRVRLRPGAEDWFGPGGEAVVMQWHGEAFGLPAGARWLAQNAACPHQAFALGPHLAMQFHVEVDAAKLADWAPEAAADPAHPHTVQDRAALEAGTARHLAAQQALAARLYRRWLAGAG
jgi:GMP synthase-like glutamine amidotransferase